MSTQIGYIYTELLSTDLMSGSSDTFRTANGGYWETTTDDDGNSSLQFVESTEQTPGFPLFERTFSTPTKATVVDSSVIIPNLEYAVRMVSTEELISDDIMWSAIWVGGQHGENSYSGIFNESVFRYFNAQVNLPYNKMDQQYLSTDYASSVIEIGYDYDQYLPHYQRTISSHTSELLIPNYYLMSDLSRWDFFNTSSTEQLYPTEMISLVSREGAYPGVNGLFDFNNNNLPEIVPSWVIESFGKTAKQNTNLSVEYLTSSMFSSPLSASTIQWAESKQKTMLFDYDSLRSIADTPSYQDCLPYKMKISFESHPVEEFSKAIQTAQFGPKFIKTLYDSFAGKLDTLSPTERALVENKYFHTGSSEGVISEINTATTSTYREIDYIELIKYAYQNFINSNENCMFIGENTMHRLAATETTSEYRYVNTIAAEAALAHAIEYLSNANNIEMEKWAGLYDNVQRHSEVVAYRIVKIGGPASGDSNTQNTLQEFWFVNGEQEMFEFYDSQVKYDTEYTYKVYSYILVVGVDYRLSDLLVSRKLGCANDAADKVGLELYNPASGDAQEEIYKSTSQPAAFNTLAGGSTYGSDAQIFSIFPYVADFKITYEPSIKIMEMPLYEKTLRVTDNPGNGLMVRPYQVMNTTQKIGFDFAYDTFQNFTFPSTLNSDEASVKENYLHANDLLETSTLSKESISYPRFIQVYRLSERPSSLSEFDGNLINVVDLKIWNERKYTYTKDFFEDIVKANQKYYYLFRVLNQQRVISHVSDVYESELINDGGYAYAVFNVLFESELAQEVFSKTDKEFKKIFQLQPNLSQLALNVEDVDFSESAASQIENLSIGAADDLIWDKTFKIRLTSKKTGRKIDLNITYNLSSE